MPSLILATLIVACSGNGDTGLSRLEQTDVFLQEPSAEVDILWVIDDSPSMAEEQQRVAEGFSEFISGIEQTGIDFHLGVISTDMDQGKTERGALVGSTPYLTAEDDYVAEFQERVRVGVDGSDKEKGMAAALFALTEPMVSGPNDGFLRDDATTTILFVSDEDDCSDGEALSGEDGSACYDRSDELIPVKDYVQDFLSLEAPGVRVVTSAIVGPEASVGCDESWPGKRYTSLAEATGGVSGDICDTDYDRIMGDLGLTVTGVRTVFNLTYPPVEDTLSVWVGDASGAAELIPGDPVSGWVYDRDHVSVRFDGDYVPPRGTTVSIAYDIGSGTPVDD